MYDSSQIASRIKLRAKQRGVTVNAMLGACGLGVNTVGKIGRGTDILTLNFTKIADYLDCSVDYLLGRTDDPEVSCRDNRKSTADMRQNKGQSVNDKQLLQLLASVRDGRTSPEDAAKALGQSAYEDLGYARVDHHRAVRQGAAEVIFGQGKTPEQIEGIVRAMMTRGADNIIITRLSMEKEAALQGKIPYRYDAAAQLAVANPAERPLTGAVAVVSAGTSDMAVCEEAALTAEALGSKVFRVYDAGVAGLHRLLGSLETLERARCIIAVAGMEGALPSVVGGLVGCPVIAVPTSVGYGANLGGLAALLAMLNSCASGVSVVNIDNGFGAGFLAHRINQMKGIDQ